MTTGNTFCGMTAGLIYRLKTRAWWPLLAILALAVMAGGSASALTLNVSFNPSVTNFGANTTAMSNAVLYAAQQFQSLYSDPITINITVAAAPGQSILGQSSTALVGFFSYTQIRNALIADEKTANDTNSVGADVPASDPSGGHLYATSSAQGKALGLIGASASQDGTTTFGAGFTYTFDPNNRAVSGAIDFIGVVEHEFSEVMGRIPGLGANFGDGGPDYLPFDLFRYTGSGIRSMTPGSGNYFSIDNGATNLKAFNFPNGGGSDPQDWASGANDSFNAFSSFSVKNDITAVDRVAMDVIGYDLVTPFQITSITMEGNNIRLVWQTTFGATNSLQATAGSSDGSYSTNSFAEIFAVTNILNTVTNYLDVGGATNSPSRYYRVRLVP